MAARFLKPGWLILGGVALLAGIWFGGPPLLRRLDFFRVRQIELIGVRHLDPDVLVSALRLGDRAGVFDDPAPLERRVIAVPGVLEVSVGRRLPGTLQIEIREAVPVAVTPRGQRLVMLDAKGRVLPFDPSRTAPDVPVTTRADSAVTRFLGRVRELDPLVYARIASAWRMKADVVLEIGGGRLVFRPDATAEEMRAVMAVAEDLARQGRSYEELDGRFANQVIVRGAAPATAAPTTAARSGA